MQELTDLQLWFNLAWFDPTLLESEPLLGLVERGRDFGEEDKQLLAYVQREILSRVISAYREAADRGQIELSTSPYFHPILPLLANSDAARVGAGDTALPHRRFAHPEDAREHVERALLKHEQVFGRRSRGMWCSEQAVGEDVLPLLMRCGVEWTISDQSVLSRSLQGSAGNPSRDPSTASPYVPYRLLREQGEMAIVFRDHTLSDLIGFAYQSWDSRDAARDLVRRLRETVKADSFRPRSGSVGGDAPTPLVTIALDGENAWEYYPRDGRDFLRYLYEALAADPALRCVTISEHLERYPASESLDWLHTGSWIGADLRTWSGDPGHNVAWDLLHEARDLAAAAREAASAGGADSGAAMSSATSGEPADAAAQARAAAESAWHHVLIAEGSDWFWWFGEHHRTDLDHVWDEEFRHHLQQVYRSLGKPVPVRLHLPILEGAPSTRAAWPAGMIRPVIDGVLTDEDGWSAAGRMSPDHPSTMHRADGTHIAQARFGWDTQHLYLLIIPRDVRDLAGLEFEVQLTPAVALGGVVFHVTLEEDGQTRIRCGECAPLRETAQGAWADVVEVALPLATTGAETGDGFGVVLRVGHGGMLDHLLRSPGMSRSEEAGA